LLLSIAAILTSSACHSTLVQASERDSILVLVCSKDLGDRCTSKTARIVFQIPLESKVGATCGKMAIFKIAQVAALIGDDEMPVWKCPR
jgi:hypothetical protein